MFYIIIVNKIYNYNVQSKDNNRKFLQLVHRK